jgi:methylglutaconyl-CoA hydratase
MRNLKEIEIDINENLATIWLNMPDTRNALSLAAAEELIKAFKWINKQEEIIIILIRGRGKSFCAGADLNWMLKSGSQKYNSSYRESQILAKCFNSIYRSDKVVICVVHGDVFGGGLGFLGASDTTFAVKNSRYCLSELRLGLVPAVIMPYLLTKVNQTAIKYQILSGEIFSAEEALEKGLIDKLCDDEDDMEIKLKNMIQKINLASPQALKETKHLLWELNKNLVNNYNIKKTVKTITRMKMSNDARERMTDFVTGKK